MGREAPLPAQHRGAAPHVGRLALDRRPAAERRLGPADLRRCPRQVRALQAADGRVGAAGRVHGDQRGAARPHVDVQLPSGRVRALARLDHAGAARDAGGLREQVALCAQPGARALLGHQPGPPAHRVPQHRRLRARLQQAAGHARFPAAAAAGGGLRRGLQRAGPGLARHGSPPRQPRPLAALRGEPRQLQPPGGAGAGARLGPPGSCALNARAPPAPCRPRRRRSRSGCTAGWTWRCSL